jgi:hypothetical protein
VGSNPTSRTDLTLLKLLKIMETVQLYLGSEIYIAPGSENPFHTYGTKIIEMMNEIREMLSIHFRRNFDEYKLRL